MRIAVSGSQATGKSTFIQDFIKEYPMYKMNKVNYRELVKSKGLGLNKKGSEASQEIILNSLLDEVMNAPSKCNIIFDRCTLDNIVHTLWLKEKYPDRISDNFLRKSIELHKQATKFYDIIFFIPITKYDKIPVESKENRETDLIYRDEINNIFNAIMKTYHQKSSGFFDMRDCPAIIEIFGSREERVQMAKFYIDPKTGDQYGEDDDLISKATLLNP